MERAGPLDISQRDPKIEILELKDDFIKFILSDTDTSVANALRRVMIGETPTMAIDLVEIEENTSVLHDEFIAHRLGMVPIRVNSSKGMDGFQYKQDCFCESHCPNCSVEFELNVTHDGDEPVLIVASSDLKSKNESVEAVTFSSQEEEYCSSEYTPGLAPGITLLKLGPGQSIKCKCVALKGISKIHAKWCPVSVATFSYEPRIELNDALIEELTDQQKEDFVKSCPTKVYALDKRTGKIIINQNHNQGHQGRERAERRCMFCDECVKLANTWKKTTEDDPVVVIDTEPNRFIFSVETNGALKPDEVVFSALKALQSKLQLLRRKVDEIQINDGQAVELRPGQAGYQDTGGFL